MSDTLAIVTQLYSNLFAVDLSDAHTYTRNGKLVKVNCYSTYFDMISGKGNKPAVFKNYGKTVAKALIDPKLLRGNYSILSNIHKDSTELFDNLIGQVEGSVWGTGGVRAEFRICLADLASMMPFLEGVFSVENIKRWTMVFGSPSIARLAKFYIHLIKRPFLSNILSIMQQLNSSRVNNHNILENIASVSLLESLLTSTLFSGLTYGFASEIVWNRSNLEQQSLELMKFIRTHNRPVFHPSFFSNGEFKVNCNAEILNLIFGKITRNPAFQFPPVTEIIQFGLVESSIEKGMELLKVYYAELNPNAFFNSGVPRWKVEALNREVIRDFNQLRLPLMAGVGALFNFDNFSSYASWKNRYYMILADEWIKKSNMTVDQFRKTMVEAMKTLGVEHIHYVGDQNYNKNAARHLLIDWPLAPSINDNPLPIRPLTLTERELMIQIRNPNLKVPRWVPQDKAALLRGVNRYRDTAETVGNYKIKIFRLIANDVEINFLYPRTPDRYKHKWDELVKSRAVYLHRNVWYLEDFNGPQRHNYVTSYRSGDSHIPVTTPVNSENFSQQSPQHTSLFTNEEQQNNVSADSEFNDYDLNDFDSPFYGEFELLSESRVEFPEVNDIIPSSEINSQQRSLSGKLIYNLISYCF